MNSPDEPPVALLGRTTFRGQGKLFGIKEADRLAHLYVVGKTGTGKTSLLKTLITQDIAHKNGLAVFDPHGDLAEELVRGIPDNRREHLIYVNAGDPKTVPAFNPLVNPPENGVYRTASGLLDAFKKIWSDSWGPRLEHILRYAFLALLEQQNATLGDVLRLLEDKQYRQTAGAQCANPSVRRFWLNEFEGYPARLRAEAVAPIQNKVGAFLASPYIQRIVSRGRSDIDFQTAMDEGKVMVVNLAKGKLGADASALLGALLLSAINVAGMSRERVPEPERRNFFVYLDEFQTIAGSGLAGMLAELRKYHVGLILAHQHVSQLEPSVRDAILGNSGTIVAFRVGAPDGELLAKEFYPEIGLRDLVNQPNYHVYLKLMIDGAISRPFSAHTIHPGHIPRLEKRRGQEGGPKAP